MADEFNTTINWWDSSSSRNRFDSSSSSSSSTTNNNSSSFGWPIRSPIDSSTSVSGSSVATDHNLHMMMGLGLSSPSQLDWNQALVLPHGGGISSDSTMSLPLSYQMDSSATNLYGNPSNTNFQETGILGSDNQNPNYHYGAGAGASNNSYGMNMNMNMNMNRSEIELPSAANKFAQFLRTSSPPKQQPLQQTHLHFSNNAPFWNASAGAGGSSMNDVRSPNFFPSLETPSYAATQSFEEKPKHHHVSEVRHSSSTAAKKSSSGTEPASKRAKNDQTESPLPAFKVTRKEKMGDRITALQQMVSPFGKTDTASVLSEAIEYIKFLHEQVAVLSTPYKKSGAPIPHQQNSEKAKESEEPKQDLRNRGLCLVPVSSTFPVTHETTVDFWTFGGTFR